MEGGGIFSLVGGLLLAPFQLAGAWHEWMRRRPPETQPLAKARHGAGLLALVAFVLVELVGLRQVGSFARALRAQPDDLTLLLPHLVARQNPQHPKISWAGVVLWAVAAAAGLLPALLANRRVPLAGAARSLSPGR